MMMAASTTAPAVNPRMRLQPPDFSGGRSAACDWPAWVCFASAVMSSIGGAPRSSDLQVATLTERFGHPYVRGRPPVQVVNTVGARDGSAHGYQRDVKPGKAGADSGWRGHGVRLRRLRGREHGSDRIGSRCVQRDIIQLFRQ